MSDGATPSSSGSRGGSPTAAFIRASIHEVSSRNITARPIVSANSSTPPRGDDDVIEMVLKENLSFGLESPSTRATQKELFQRLQGWSQKHSEVSLAVQKVKVAREEYCRLLGAFQEALTGELDGLGITQVPRIADLLGRYREVSGMLEEEHSMLLNSLTIAYGTPLQMDAARVAHEECINAGDEYELESRRYLDGLESQLRAEVKSPD